MTSRPGRSLDLGRIQVVSWDLDGTLYSSRRAFWHLWTEAARAAILQFQWGPIRETLELQHLWKRMEAARAAGGNVTALDAVLRRRLELERRWLVPAVALAGARAGVTDLVRYFRVRVPAQIVLTDYEAGDKLRCLGLEDQFSAVYAGERLGFLKPHPAVFLKALDELDVSPERLLHIGDRSGTDGAAAAAAGCRALVLGRDFRSFARLFRELAGDA